MRSPAIRLLGVVFLIGTPAAEAVMTFTPNFTAQAQSDFSATEQATILAGISFWDDVIEGHRDGVNRNWVLTIDSFSTPSAGGGTVLGSGNVTGVAFSGFVSDAHTSNNRFIISTAGMVSFNSHPDAGDVSIETVRHEIGHALGIGTLWEDNELYTDGVVNPNREGSGVPGQLIGPATLAAYQAEFDPTATFVPVELDGGSGSAHRHWNSVSDHWNSENSPGFDSDPGDGSSAPTNGNGDSLDNSLMSAVQSGNNWLTNTSRANLIDLGFTVVPVPEPGSSALLATGLLILLGRRQRR